MRIATEILQTIEDGSWHSLKNIAEKHQTSIENVTDEAKTLSEVGILVYDEKANKVKLSSWVLNLFSSKELQEIKDTI